MTRRTKRTRSGLVAEEEGPKRNKRDKKNLRKWRTKRTKT